MNSVRIRLNEMNLRVAKCCDCGKRLEFNYETGEFDIVIDDADEFDKCVKRAILLIGDLEHLEL